MAWAYLHENSHTDYIKEGWVILWRKSESMRGDASYAFKGEEFGDRKLSRVDRLRGSPVSFQAENLLHIEKIIPLSRLSAKGIGKYA